jgi:hypothetical protein
MKRLLVSALPATGIASGVVLLVLAFSGCGGGTDTATTEAAPDEPETAEQSGYEQGYQTGYSFCNGQTVRQVAGEFEVSEEPKAAAEGFAASFEPEQREGAYEGCYDGLLGKPLRVP